jgi:UDP-glucose 4-epimerase
VAEVRTPDYIRDNIHPDLLGGVYSKFAEQVFAAPCGLIKTNPSGYVETQGSFAKRVAREVAARTGWPCGLEVTKQEDFSEPLARMNTEPATQKVPHWNEGAAWDAFVQFYTRTRARPV